MKRGPEGSRAHTHVVDPCLDFTLQVDTTRACCLLGGRGGDALPGPTEPRVSQEVPRWPGLGQPSAPNGPRALGTHLPPTGRPSRVCGTGPLGSESRARTCLYLTVGMLTWFPHVRYLQAQVFLLKPNVLPQNTWSPQQRPRGCPPPDAQMARRGGKTR